MITQFLKASSALQAERIRAATPNAVFIAGGTHLLAPELRGQRIAAVAIDGLVSRALRVSTDRIAIGALATLQELLDLERPGAPGSSNGAPLPASHAGEGGSGIECPELALLCGAARSLANRNVRNRATVGGNVAADRPASTLLPALLALDARLRLADGRSVSIAEYLEARRSTAPRPGAAGAEDASAALIDEVIVPITPARRCAFARWARTENDLSGVAVAVAFVMDADRISQLRVAATGIAGVGAAPAAAAQELRTVRIRAVEALFEGAAPPDREQMERSIAPLIESADDVRASGAYKRLRGAQLIAEAIHAAYTEGAR